MNNRAILAMMVVSFLIYNVMIYTHGTDCGVQNPVMSEQAKQGKKIWQENNCISCHRLYGLGGYRGTDLTNTISSPKRGEAYARTFIKNGTNIMPNFQFSDEEVDRLIEYLKYVDQTGTFPNPNTEFGYDGFIYLKRYDE